MRNTSIVIPRHFTPPKSQSYFLFGPRGTGKSQLLRTLYKNAVVIDLLDETVLLKYSTHPEDLGPVVSAMKDGEHLIIDEVQKSPQLLAKIHQLMEDPKYPQISYVLTGSSARKLKRDGVDLLSGRAIVKTMHPFMISELKNDFDFDERLDLGTLPLVWGSSNPRETLNSYIALYLREEVKMERVVKNLESFSRFLEAMSYSHGEVLNLSNVARDCGVKRSTCDGHLEILEDLLLGYRLPIFKNQNRKQTVESVKFYYFDSGVFQAIRPKGPLEDSSKVIGQALEGFVEQHLRAWISYRNQGDKLFYWRTRAGNEVDFILYGPKLFHAIEVKNSSKIDRSDFSGLKSFLEDYPQAEATLLYRGNNKEKHGQILCLPIETFLSTLG